MIQGSRTDDCQRIAHADRNDRARIALLGLLHAVENVVGAPRADLTLAKLLDALAVAAKKTSAAHQRVWSK